ncbi:MAG TPA: cytochrome c-type biogenesis protein [Ktedonobacterales bacterium]|nr:cytochrome c-type biogenesis protein [Ktedonobacterales bacterium]HUY79456.1 cytochrome c-type biogenesis protein [Ktedonobacterales bacterium]
MDEQMERPHHRPLPRRERGDREAKGVADGESRGVVNGRARWVALLRRPGVVAPLALLLVVIGVWGALLVNAAQPKTLDQRAYDVERQLQCPICHGQSVADSPSLLSQQMRGIVRQKLAHGESEQQVINDFRASYGDSILMTPPPTTYIWLWGPPALILLLGGYLVYALGREWRTPALATAGAAYDAYSDADDDGADLDAMPADERRGLRDLLRRELAADEGAPVSLFADDGDSDNLAADLDDQSGDTPIGAIPAAQATIASKPSSATQTIKRAQGARSKPAQSTEGARIWDR